MKCGVLGLVLRFVYIKCLQGGAIFDYHGVVTAKKTVFTNNHATNGGAVDECVVMRPPAGNKSLPPSPSFFYSRLTHALAVILVEPSPQQATSFLGTAHKLAQWCSNKTMSAPSSTTTAGTRV